MTLWTYIIPYDDGSAPNPFRGICTLAICKPAIRRNAKPGDWIAGLGSRNAPRGRDLSGCLVYAMCVKESIPWSEYDRRARTEWPHRIPNINSLDMSERLGDCLYDHSGPQVTQRRGVHPPDNQIKDLNGNVLIAEEFYYFGRDAIQLPPELGALPHQNQGHRSISNQALEKPFERWIRDLGYPQGQLSGWPDFVIDWSGKHRSYGVSAYARLVDSEEITNGDPLQ